MKTAFEILEVSEDATDDAIKQAYLQKVKQYPPEQAPEQFQLIRTAYEAIKTKSLRIKYQLFAIVPPEPADIIEHAFKPSLPTETAFMQALSTLLILPDINHHG